MFCGFCISRVTPLLTLDITARKISNSMLKHLIFIHKSELTDCHAGLYPQNLLLQQRGETLQWEGSNLFPEKSPHSAYSARGRLVSTLRHWPWGCLLNTTLSVSEAVPRSASPWAPLSPAAAAPGRARARPANGSAPPRAATGAAPASLKSWAAARSGGQNKALLPLPSTRLCLLRIRREQGASLRSNNAMWQYQQRCLFFPNINKDRWGNCAKLLIFSSWLSKPRALLC